MNANRSSCIRYDAGKHDGVAHLPYDSHVLNRRMCLKALLTSVNNQKTISGVQEFNFSDDARQIS